MYGLFTKMGLGAVVSAGLSVLGISYLCSDPAPNQHHQRPPALVAVQADAALGVGAVPSAGPGHGGGSNPGNQNPGNDNPGNHNPGNQNPGNQNPGTYNPGTYNPGNQNPSPTCCNTLPPLVNVEPDVDLDVDVDVKLPDVDAPTTIVGGVLGTVGVVVDGVLPDCGCNQPVLLPLPVLGH